MFIYCLCIICICILYIFFYNWGYIMSFASISSLLITRRSLSLLYDKNYHMESICRYKYTCVYLRKMISLDKWCYICIFAVYPISNWLNLGAGWADWRGGSVPKSHFPREGGYPPHLLPPGRSGLWTGSGGRTSGTRSGSWHPNT